MTFSVMTREDAEKKWDEMSPFVIKALLKVVNKKETTSKKMNKMAVDKETSSINETTEGEAEEADKGDEEGMEEESEGQSKEDTEKARVDKLTMLVFFVTFKIYEKTSLNLRVQVSCIRELDFFSRKQFFLQKLHLIFY